MPAQITGAVAGIPHALVPASIKALDRLIGAAVDIPIAWLNQKKAQIDSQTQAYAVVERAIADAVASEAGADGQTVKNAVNILVRKAYRKQVNREAVAGIMIEELREPEEPLQAALASEKLPNLDEDWLNVFERYAEDASTERMQNLWGRVLAGEIRKPGRYSMRSLRFLSEFSQADGLMFSEFCKSVFGDLAPTALVKPAAPNDIRDLIYLESSGLIQGASGGLKMTLTFNGSGNAFLKEGKLALLLQGNAGSTIDIPACILTPLGQELLGLLPGRDGRVSARSVANAIKSANIESAFLATIVNDSGQLLPMEILWQKETSQAAPAR